MERPLHALPGTFLQELRESKALVVVFLVNGIRLQGQVHFFDNYIVALKSTVTQLVYKHAISTIAPIKGEVVQSSAKKSGMQPSHTSLSAQSHPSDWSKKMCVQKPLIQRTPKG